MAGERVSAMIAAAQISAGLAEVMRFASDGRSCDWCFDPETDPVAQLAEGLLRSAEIALADLDGRGRGWDPERELLGQLIAACRRFVDGWSGD